MYQKEGAGRKKGRDLLTRAGYKAGGHVKSVAADAVGQHEAHDHKGAPKTKLKLKSGGKAEGGAAAPRLDKLARGGAAKKKGAATKVNIVIAMPKGGDDKAAQAVGMMQGAAGAKASMPKPMMPPMGAGPAGPGAGGPPPLPPMPPQGPGAPTMPPPGGMKRGGRAKLPDAGAASGEGRLEKAALQRGKR